MKKPFTRNLLLHSSTRESRNLATGAGRCSRRCAGSSTRQTLRSSKSGSGKGTPVWSHGGIVCTGETYKNVVKMTFAKGASLKDPSGLFNSSLDGNVRRAIDIHEGDKIDEAALKDLIRAAVALNLEGQEQAEAPASEKELTSPTQAKAGLNGAPGSCKTHPTGGLGGSNFWRVART